MRRVRRLFLRVAFAAVAFALVLPIGSLRTGASIHPTNSNSSSVRSPQSARPATTSSLVEAEQSEQTANPNTDPSPIGRISKQTLGSLGLRPVADPENTGNRIAHILQRKKKDANEVSIQSGQPTVLNSRSALSAAL